MGAVPGRSGYSLSRDGNPLVPWLRCHSSISASYWHTPTSVLALWGVVANFSIICALVSCTRVNGDPLIPNPPRPIPMNVPRVFGVDTGGTEFSMGYMIPVAFGWIAGSVGVHVAARYAGGLDRWLFVDI